MSELKLTVNGTEYNLDVPQSRTLAEVLRYDLGFTGTKIGCNEAECGICTVHVDGIPADSCIYPAFKAQGRSITTIEGLAHGSQLDPLQEAFIDHGAVQCGFCTPGLIMNAAALLESNPNPDDQDIKIALKDTYCRCTGYTSVISAIKSAAAKKRGESPLPVNFPQVVEPLRVVGHNEKVQHVVDQVTGKAKFTDDYTFDGMLFGRTLRSRYPHARIVSIDASEALKLKGVKGVLTGKDFNGWTWGWMPKTREEAPLAVEKVRFYGEGVAAVCAVDEATAEAACELIRVDYEELPGVFSIDEAMAEGAPLVHEDRPGNLSWDFHMDFGDVEALSLIHI